MKNKHLYTIMCVAGLAAATTACDDYLDTSSPSVVDADFVFSNSETARSAMHGAYASWRSVANGSIFGDGLFYAIDATGSDIERHPEAYKNQTGRHIMEGLYENGAAASTYGLLSYNKEGAHYNPLYDVIGKCNAVITAMQAAANFKDIVTNATEPSALSQMYGEAVALRATAYRELIKYYGDVPYNAVFGEIPGGLVSRDSIYEVCIAELKQVEPLMYPVGSIPGVDSKAKNYLSRTYVQALIGRMSLEAGGYQVRRGDFNYVDGKGEALSFDKLGTPNNGAFYGRRSDWKTLYADAKTYFKKAIDNPGSATMHWTDPRSAEKNGRSYDNPYQYFFQQMHEADATYADESIYEYPQQQGIDSDARPYALGRPSNGGGKNAYPCKDYGQGRITPAYYYGVFAPNDKRRDVSATVTGSNGKGVEMLIPFQPNSKSNGGGIAWNKWDENRQAEPWTKAQRQSGINGPYMRMAEAYLGYAEACAALGEDGEAKTYLTMIRKRSFPEGQDNTDAFIKNCGSTLRAVIEERGFEYAGEGDRRFTLIRTGFLPDAIKHVKDLTQQMIDGLKANGYYTFENGNQISRFIWTKLVDAKSEYGYRLTTQCPADKTDDPVLYPSWRGQNDDWTKYGLSYGTDAPKTNLAIKGLFKYIDPEGDEAKALEADGYTKVNWGEDIVNNEDEYNKYFFYNYDYTSAPIYLVPFTPNTILNGGFLNGYGFANE